MPKQPLKFAVVKACALACIVGLTLNTFAIASGSAGRMASMASKSLVRANAPVQKPMPLPTPAQPVMAAANDNLAAQADEGRHAGQCGFGGELIHLSVVTAAQRDMLNYLT